MKKLTFLFALVALAAFPTLQAQQGMEFSNKSWTEVLEMAKTSRKAIFVDAYTTWCGPCKKMAKFVFTDPKVGEFYNEHFINVQMDMEKGDGILFAQKYSVDAYPTLLYFNADGELAHRVLGFKEINDFLAEGKTALHSSQRLGELTKRYNTGERSPEFLFEYAYANLKAGEKIHKAIAKAYLETQNDWSSDKNLQFIFDFTDDTRSREFNYFIENRQLFETKFGTAKVFNKVQTLVQGRLDETMSRKAGDTEGELREVNLLLQKVYKEEAIVKFAAFRMDYYRTQGDRNGFAKAAVDYVDNMKGITADELNSIARTFAEVIDDKEMLNKAVDWTKRAIEMENLYSYHYTLAALYFKLDKAPKAKKSAKKAIKMAQKVGDDAKPIEDLYNEIVKGKKTTDKP